MARQSRRLIVALAPVVLMTVCGVGVAGRYPGSFTSLALFNTAACLCVACAFLPPYSYVYTSLTIFLLLGFWVKALAAFLGLPSLIEVTGNFSGSQGEWDRAMITVAAGFAGSAFAKLLYSRLNVSLLSHDAPKSAPRWFVGHFVLVWAATALVLLVGNALNWRYNFYQVGVDPTLILPWHINVLVSWWLRVAAPMWVALLISWEARRRNEPRQLAALLLVPIAEAFAATVIMLSRGAYLIRVLPYLLGLARGEIRRALGLRPASLAAMLVVVVVAFVGSLAMVSWLRLAIYPRSLDGEVLTSVTASEPAPSGATETTVTASESAHGSAIESTDMRTSLTGLRTVTSTQAWTAANQIRRMVLGRWIGLEGVLAVSTTSKRGPKVFWYALFEDPDLANFAIYQRVAKSTYKPESGFTFLTVPGIIAVLAFSDSRLMVLLGMLLTTALMLCTEEAFSRVLASETLCAVVGVVMANAVCQMIFPYLTAVFFAQVWGTLVALWLMTRIGRFA